MDDLGGDMLGALIRFCVCTAVLSLAGFGLITVLQKDYPRAILQECEAELPRSQNCELIAVPALEGKQDG